MVRTYKSKFACTILRFSRSVSVWTLNLLYFDYKIPIIPQFYIVECKVPLRSLLFPPCNVLESILHFLESYCLSSAVNVNLGEAGILMTSTLIHPQLVNSTVALRALSPTYLSLCHCIIHSEWTVVSLTTQVPFGRTDLSDLLSSTLFKLETDNLAIRKRPYNTEPRKMWAEVSFEMVQILFQPVLSFLRA